MIFLDTDIFTLLVSGHDRVAARFAAATEDVAVPRRQPPEGVATR
jgi:hypothetical protein